jgi:hypothetical protein
MVFSGDVDDGEIAATIETGEHDGIEAISFATVSWFSWNKRRSNNVTMEAILGKAALENEAGPGCFVTGPDLTLLRQATKETTELHQIIR